MKKTILMSLLLVSSFPSLAETKNTIGIGYQYGGVFGYKFSSINNNNIYFISAGLVGGAAGYQLLLDGEKKHSIGIALGSEVLTSEKGFGLATYNYYSQGVNKSGFVFGLGIGVRREDEGGVFGSYGKVESKFTADVNLGYQF
ncbi:hypothetical protein D5R81_08300 [Parashewanella spongiae]|uniref:Outer membrane protein beta-barrel domain-containing protein n=1 Tax=Parashewanella spongiae TaxID=342950 RepID=A0A3A6U081_9GAMM|nr:hypothetical protein [Parashewanella spongiae]MCL1080307.1 hypothetical protein [Parashewanella spongiae]RJY17463.1 hypothetical protein D5R81_08300 [Parashewanella spongiae]